MRRFIFYSELLDLFKTGLKFIGKHLLDRVVTSVKITSDDYFYDELVDWIIEHNKTGRTFTKYRFSTKSNSRNSELDKTLDYGNYFIKIEGHYFLVTVSSLDLDYGKDDKGDDFKKVNIRDEIKLTAFGNAEKLESLLNSIKSEYEYKTSSKISIYCSEWSNWSKCSQLPIEIDEGYVFDDPQLTKLDQEVNTWLKSKSYYKSRGIPYRRGWLLWGPPGTGKTSIVKYLAKKYGLNIFICNKKALKEEHMFYKFHQKILRNSILLFEDIDAIIKGRETDKDIVDFSTFINVLDGLPPLEDVLIFMTTNDKTELDPALTRPGRIDKEIYIGYTTDSVRQKMFSKFFPKSKLVLPQPKADITPADLQEIFLGSETDEEAARKVEEWAGKP